MFFQNSSLGNNSGNSGANKTLMKKSKSQQTVSYEVFKDHWKQAQAIFTKSLVSDDDIEIVKNNLTQMIFLLMDELNTIANLTLNSNKMNMSIDSAAEINNKFHGPIWSYLINSNIFETVYLWSLSYPEYLYDLKCEQLKYYESLINHMQSNEQTNLLLYSQLYKPLFSLLNHCSTHTSEEIEKHVIAILNQLCVCICKNANLLNIFFDTNNNNSSSSSNSSSTMPTSSSFILNNSSELIFERAAGKKQSEHEQQLSQQQMYKNSSKAFIFNLLIPYIHKEGCLGFQCYGSLSYGQQARDTLLMIMQLSSRNANLAKYIVDCTDFCPILATGLSGLYSELPQKFSEDENYEEVHYLQREDIINIPALNKFINSLEFCNNVIQVSHSQIANQLLQYIYYGFLVPVVAPALTQNCKNEIVVATCYLDLFLRTVNEPNLLKLFLKFILYAKFDERITLLDTLIARINSCDKLSLATLMLFYTMINLNSEDVMYRLILCYLLPCKHIVKPVEQTMESELNSGENVEALLALSTYLGNSAEQQQPQPQSNDIFIMQQSMNRVNYIVANSSMYLNENNPVNRWLNSIFDPNELLTILSFYDNMRFNFIEYLKDAKSGILKTSLKTNKWSCQYEESNNNNTNTTALQNDSETKSLSRRANLISSPTNDKETNSDAKTNTSQFQELDCDPDEFLFHLKLNASSLDEANVKSLRSTMNLFSSKDATDLEMEEVESVKSEKKRAKMPNSKKVKNTKKPVKQPSKSNKSPRKSKNRTNDFYMISFDNELSETDTAESTTTTSRSLSPLSDKSEILDDSASYTSNATINNDSSSLSLNSKNRLDQSTSSLSNEGGSRDKLVEHLFLNETNREQLFESSDLNQFLTGLDRFFTDLDIKTNKVKSRDLGLVFEQIVSLYNTLSVANRKSGSRRASPANSNKSSRSNSNAKPEENDVLSQKPEEPVSEKTNETNNSNIEPTNSSSNLSEFPVYNGNDSFNSSTDSINTNSQTVDSGIESTKESGARSGDNSSDIGPFLSAILTRLDTMLTNSLEVNLLITGLIARLAYYHQYLMRTFLLNSDLVLQPNVKSLPQILAQIKVKIETNSANCHNFSLLYLKAKLHLIRRLLNKSFSLQQQAQLMDRVPQPDQNYTRISDQSPNCSGSSVTSQGTTPTSKKKSSFKVSKLLSIFFSKSTTTDDVSTEVVSAAAPTQETVYRNEAFGLDLETNPTSTHSLPIVQTASPNTSLHNTSLDFATLDKTSDSLTSIASPPQVDLDLHDGKTKYSKSVRAAADEVASIESGSGRDITQSEFYDFIIADNEWMEPRARNLAFSAVIFDEFVKELAAICQEHSVF